MGQSRVQGFILIPVSYTHLEQKVLSDELGEKIVKEAEEFKQKSR